MSKKAIMEKMIDTYFLHYIHSTEPVYDAFKTLTNAAPISYDSVEDNCDGLNHGLFEGISQVLGAYVEFRSEFQAQRARFQEIRRELKEDRVDVYSDGVDPETKQHINECQQDLSTVNGLCSQITQSMETVDTQMLQTLQQLTADYQGYFQQYASKVTELATHLIGRDVSDNQSVVIILRSRSMKDLQETADRQTDVKMGGDLTDYKNYIGKVLEFAVQANQQARLDDNLDKIKKLLSEVEGDISTLASTLGKLDSQIEKMIKSSAFVTGIAPFLGDIKNIDELLSKVARRMRDKIPLKAKDDSQENTEALKEMIETTPTATRSLG